jgi:ribosomal peptide maturation radical SAM protein 1
MKKSSQVALIQMPFAITLHPSLGLSLLKGQLESRSISVDILYFNMLFSKIFGFEKYHCISQGGVNMTDLIGEWIFRFGNDDEESICSYEQMYFLKHKRLNQPEKLLEILNIAKEMRSSYEEFIEKCFDATDWSRYKIVGFTTMFEQTNACLQLAKRIKISHPSINIIFGGANCDGTMGKTLLKCYDFIDAVCVGEGDISFPRYVQNILDETLFEVSGIITKSDSKNQHSKRAEVAKLDDLPFPIYDDFFEQYEYYSVSDTKMPRIMFETSRGCWWGQKNHCTFCGLNGTTMEFRQKSAQRALKEISHIVEKRGDKSKQFFATDNIMPVSYFKDFLPELKKADLKLEFFYETKANLKKDQLKLYKEAGLNAIQPGIESLDTSILKLMKKGTSSLQNIQLLKWCKEFDILPYWNYLVGFPGEDTSCYDTQAKLVKLLFHLPSPGPMAMVRFDRFSPYLVSPENFGIKNLTPYRSYEIVFKDIPKDLLYDYAYYFEADYHNKTYVDEYTTRVQTHNTHQTTAATR